MTQTRVWDFKEIDSTAILNAMILATLRNRNIGSTATTQIRPGRLAGLVPTAHGPIDEFIDLDLDGLTYQMSVTNDGVIIVEDANVMNVGPFGNMAGNPRIDIVAVKHAYSGALPNVAATYVIVAGVAAVNPLPNYAALAVDETPLAEVWIDAGAGAPNIPQTDIRMLPSALDIMVADHETGPSPVALGHGFGGQTDNDDADAGVWARMGRNDDRFYIMRDPDDDSRVFMVLNAYWASDNDNWYQQDVARRSSLLVVGDTAGAGAVIFGMYSADPATGNNTFANFWTLAPIDAGEPTTDTQVATRLFTLSRLFPWKRGLDSRWAGTGPPIFTVGAGDVLIDENLLTRVAPVTVTVNLGTTYNAGVTHGRRVGEAFPKEAQADGFVVLAGNTFTSAAANFVVDGIQIGDHLEILAPAANAGSYCIKTVAANTLTLDPTYPFGAEGPVGYTVQGWYFIYATDDWGGGQWGIAYSTYPPDADWYHPVETGWRCIGSFKTDGRIASADEVLGFWGDGSHCLIDQWSGTLAAPVMGLGYNIIWSGGLTINWQRMSTDLTAPDPSYFFPLLASNIMVGVYSNTANPLGWLTYPWDGVAAPVGAEGIPIFYTPATTSQYPIVTGVDRDFLLKRTGGIDGNFTLFATGFDLNFDQPCPLL